MQQTRYRRRVKQTAPPAGSLLKATDYPAAHPFTRMNTPQTTPRILNIRDMTVSAFSQTLCYTFYSAAAYGQKRSTR